MHNNDVLFLLFLFPPYHRVFLISNAKRPLLTTVVRYRRKAVGDDSSLLARMEAATAGSPKSGEGKKRKKKRKKGTQSPSSPKPPGADRSEEGGEGRPPAGNGKKFSRGPQGPQNFPPPEPQIPKPLQWRSPRAETLASPAMVIAVEGGFVHEEEEVDHPIRYLPLGRVYSSSAPCPLPKKPRSAEDGKPPVIVYYRRRRKKPRVEGPPPSPATAPPMLHPREDDEDEEVTRRKGSLKYELLSLGQAPPALGGDGEEPARRRCLRRSGGAERRGYFSEPKRRQRQGVHKEAASSAGRRWLE